MNYLALDTATDVVTTCVTVAGEVVGETATREGSRAAQHVLADIDALLADAGLGLHDLGGICVGVGPGTFTGVRIGIATARGLGMALGIPVAGHSTLAALLAADGVDVACIDARRGEVFAAGAGIAPCAVSPHDLARLVPPGATVAGDGAVLYRAELPAAVIPADDDPRHIPWARYHAASFDPAAGSDPVYLRAPDADRNLAAAGGPPR